MTGSERPSPEPLLKKEVSQPYWGGENSGNALEASNALNYRGPSRTGGTAQNCLSKAPPKPLLNRTGSVFPPPKNYLGLDLEKNTVEQGVLEPGHPIPGTVVVNLHGCQSWSGMGVGNFSARKPCGWDGWGSDTVPHNRLAWLIHSDCDVQGAATAANVSVTALD